MKAAIRTQYGLPSVLEVKEVELPVPGKNDVLIKVHATTVNRSDCHVLWGKPFFMRFFTGLFTPRLASTGTDFAGEITAVGSNVYSFKPGDKVMGFGGVFGCGSHAQYLVLAQTKPIIIIPEHLTYEEAAACLEGAIYAAASINMLKPQTGQQVLVNGATGAIGSAMVQILKSYGTQVTAVCRGEDKSLVIALGADRVIDYTTEDFTQDSTAYDLIFDAIGKSTFSKCQGILKELGIYSSSEPDLSAAVISLFTRGKKTVFPPLPNTMAELRFIKDLIEKGKFKPLIDRKYPLIEIAKAYEYVATGQKKGNVILIMDT